MHWALGRYKREKSWEKRFAAYADLLGALSDMQRVLDIKMTADMIRQDITSDRLESLDADYEISLKAVMVSQGLSGFYFSPDIGEILRKLPTDLDNAAYHATTVFESFDARWGVLETAKSKVIDIAKTELNFP